MPLMPFLFVAFLVSGAGAATILDRIVIIELLLSLDSPERIFCPTSRKTKQGEPQQA